MPPTAPDLRLSRRSSLAALAALGSLSATGCTSGDDRLGGPSGRARSVDPDIAVVGEALAALRVTQQLIAAVGDRHPRLLPRLDSARVAHEAHVTMLDGAVPTGAASGATASDGPPDIAGDIPGNIAGDIPRDPARALARVVAAEEELTTVVKRLAFRAQSGPFARLLGSIAASAAQQAAGFIDRAATGGRK